ncbi:YjbH domain-containing protein [Gammaproteobacteria bacterium]|nr:YjbH domain-containing protein [Gammaproteobacteria bacterium]
MKKRPKHLIVKLLLLVLVIYINPIYSDSYKYNLYNNYGIVGTIHTPSARTFDEGVYGVTLYKGTPNQTVTFSSSPFDWLEASFFYTNIQDRPYCYDFTSEFCLQDFKDKGFNIKARLKEQGVFPALAIGLNDFAGTGLYSSEYIVGSYGINRTDFHFGIGFGLLNGSDLRFKNPLGNISDNFYDRPTSFAAKGGSFQPSRYFSGETASPFFGLSHAFNNKLLLKAEYDSSVRPGIVPFRIPENDFSFGIDYLITDSLSIGVSYERGDYASFKFVYKNNPVKSYKSSDYARGERRKGDNKYTQLISNLEENGIGVKKLTRSASSIGLSLTQNIHPNLKVVEQIIAQSARDAGITEDIKKDIEIANLLAVSEIDDAYRRSSQTIYERNSGRAVNTNTRLQFRPFLASREEFFKGALLVENDTEFVIRENLFFNTNLKYSLWDNFDDLYLPPVDSFPAQVRSDVKEYLNKMNDGGILIGRAQLDYHLTPIKNHHIMMSAGIFEDMFSGAGMEYLYFKPNMNYSFGIDIFTVRKRDYSWGFGHLDYENTAATANFYYRNYGTIPFDMSVSAGEYLAGDVGYTLEFSRSFYNGVQFGVFATFTDVTSEQFGEGSFDKGIFFNIPIYGNLIAYTWRPLTKDPGAKLNRRHTLHSLLVRLKPIN